MSMKRAAIGLLMVGLLATSQPAMAQTLSVSERLNMLQEIQRLMEQVLALQLQLERVQAAGPTRISGIYKSRFYEKSFEAVYNVDDTKLSRVGGRSIRYGDRVLWDTYLNLVGEDFVAKHLTEFRIFNDDDSVMGAFIEQKNDMTWLLAVNRFGEDLAEDYDSEFMIELLLHESAHIPFFADSDYQDDFNDEFWSNKSIERHRTKVENTKNLTVRSELGDKYYIGRENDFVTSYAASSPTEDLVESFVDFVVNDKPTGNKTKDQKVKFFYDYPELINWRSELRNSGLI